jgi:uracil-DNA glycosylase
MDLSQHLDNGVISFQEAVELASQTGWGELDFFSSGRAGQVAAHIDDRLANGAHVLPRPSDVFRALHLTAPDRVQAVILGQDPYPTPGDAHGLAFSIAGGSRKLPMSLRTIFKSLENDTGIGPPQHGDLTGWAHNGVLLLNTSLTVEAGKANSHRKAGWQELAAEVMAFLNAQPGPVVFMLWGNQAQEAGKAIDRNRHCVIETAHPSPLAHGRGPEHRFVAAQPFRQAADWLQQRNLPAIDWQLPCRPTAD